MMIWWCVSLLWHENATEENREIEEYYLNIILKNISKKLGDLTKFKKIILKITI